MRSGFARCRCGWLFLAVVLVGLINFAAHAQDSTLTRLIRQNHYPLVAAGPQFSGKGWAELQAAVRQSQFVLVGEDHGIAQVPPFTAALARELKPAVFVAEVDPYIAQQVTELVAQPGPAVAYLRQYPEALCFYDWAEEFELVRTLRAQQTALVGIDQVYGSTAAPFYAQLAGLVKDKRAKAYLQQRAVAYQHQAQAYEKLGNDDWVMDKQLPSALDSLLLLTKGESLAAQKMAQDYAASYHIYQSHRYGTNGHQERLNLMKHNLLQVLRPYQTATGLAAPKMLFKFGSNHLARGLSQSVKGEYYDVGNLVQNLAESEGQQSLHLYITGKQGICAESDNPNFPAKTTATYTAADKAELKLFLEQVAGPQWSLFDLRPARRAITIGKLQLPNQFLQRTIMGYDYLVVIPETTASHLMQQAD